LLGLAISGVLSEATRAGLLLSVNCLGRQKSVVVRRLLVSSLGRLRSVEDMQEGPLEDILEVLSVLL